MQHEGAKEMLASERYLLGELSTEERDQFEEHFFTCRDCATEMRESAVFFENLEAVLKEDAREVKEERAGLWERLTSWFTLTSLVPAGAAAALAIIAGWQQFVRIPAMERALAPAAVATAVLGPATRGEAPQVVVARSAAEAMVVLEVNAPASVRQLYWTLRTASGREVVRLTSANGPFVTLRLHADTLLEDRYELVLANESGEVLDRYRFTVKRE